jgi:peptidoglycan/LPS O-acetylase OafA/YrhL
MDPRIDRLRGLLAIGVLLGHAIDLAQLSTPNPSGTLFSAALATRPFYGFICVVGFIVLSGYCIARSTMKGFSLGQYTVKRVTRVYPLLIVAVLLTALLEWAAFDSPYRPVMWTLGRDVRKFIAALAGFSGFKGHFGALAPAYTISFELLYYAIWGLAMTTAGGRGRRALLVAAAAAGMLIVFGGRMRDALGWFAGFVPVIGIAVFPGWLLGAALALAEDQVARATRVIPIWATWVLFVWIYAYGVDAFNMPFAFSTSDYVNTAYLTTMSGLFVTMVATWLARPAPAANAADTWLGEISYPLFLIHGPVIIGLQFAMNAWRVPLTFVANLAILLAGSFIAAMLLVTFVERPVMAWRRRIRFPGTTARSVAEAATSQVSADRRATPASP